MEWLIPSQIRNDWSDGSMDEWTETMKPTSYLSCALIADSLASEIMCTRTDSPMLRNCEDLGVPVVWFSCESCFTWTCGTRAVHVLQYLYWLLVPYYCTKCIAILWRRLNRCNLKRVTEITHRANAFLSFQWFLLVENNSFVRLFPDRFQSNARR